MIALILALFWLVSLMCFGGCGSSDSGSRGGKPVPPIRAGNWSAYPYGGGHKDKLAWLTETTEEHQREWVRLQGETPGLTIQYVHSAAAVSDAWREHHAAGHAPDYPHQYGFACTRERLVVTFAGPKDEGWHVLHHAVHVVYGDPGHTWTWNPNTALTSKPVVDWWDVDLSDYNVSLALSFAR